MYFGVGVKTGGTPVAPSSVHSKTMFMLIVESCFCTIERGGFAFDFFSKS